MVHIDNEFDSVSFKRTTHLSGSLARLAMNCLIERRITTYFIPDDLGAWKTTKLGQGFCKRLCNVDENDVKFCKECGQVLPDESYLRE